jgi:hypothetical protein
VFRVRPVCLWALGRPCRVDARALPQQGTFFSGYLLKRGATERSAFKERWLALSRQELKYGVKAGERPLGTIDMRDVVGVAVGFTKARSFKSSPVTGAGVSRADRSRTEGDSHGGGRLRNSLFWRTGPEMSKTTAERQRAEAAVLSREEFAVCCSDRGIHKGRMYVFKCPDNKTRERWIELLSRVVTSYSGTPLVAASALQVS